MKTDSAQKYRSSEIRELPRWEASSKWPDSQQGRSRPSRGLGDQLRALTGPLGPSALCWWDYILTHQLVLVCYQSVINLLSMMTFLDHLLGPCVANVNHEKCCVRHDQPDSYRWWDNINEHFVFGVILNCLLWQIDCRQVKDFSAHQVLSLFGSEQGHSNSLP